jgi:RimJ/RimL family protein N-acetyltransferase
MLFGEGFSLRPLSREDAVAYFETMQDPDTISFLNSVPTTLDEVLEEIDEMIVRKGSESFTVLVDGTCAGNIRVEYQDYDESSGVGRLHLWVHPSFRRQGLATRILRWAVSYCFDIKKMHKIIAQCKESNKGMCRANEKAGFVLDYTKDVDGVRKCVYVKTKSF